MNRSDLKNKAKEQLEGKRGILALVTLIPTILSIGMNLGTRLIESILLLVVLSLVMSCVSLVLQYGVSKIYLDVANNKQVSIYDIFVGFTSKAGLKSIGLGILIGLIALIPSVAIYVIAAVIGISSVTTTGIGTSFIAIMIISIILVLIIEIIISLIYSQAFFILCDDNNKGVVECLSLSRRLMKGHKRELFVLMLSFILWILLIIVTCGIASLYVSPYMSTVFADYYLQLKGSDKVDNTMNSL